MDVLCLLGGSLGTYRYSVYNNKAPFTAVDIEVLNSTSNPELLLFTWNNDSRTFAMDNKELQDHRLGIYDWMQRCTNLVTWTIMNGAYGITLLAEDVLNYKLKRVGNSISSVNSPGKLTDNPQLLLSLFQMVGAIAAYPINQLEKVDPSEMNYSLSHPDGMFFGFWYSWIIELYVRMVRSVIGSFNDKHFLLIGKPVRYYYVMIARNDRFTFGSRTRNIIWNQNTN